MNKTIEEILKENRRFARFDQCGHVVVDEAVVIELVKQNYTPNSEIHKKVGDGVRGFMTYAFGREQDYWRKQLKSYLETLKEKEK